MDEWLLKAALYKTVKNIKISRSIKCIYTSTLYPSTTRQTKKIRKQNTYGYARKFILFIWT